MPVIYEFGDGRLDLGRRELSIQGQLADLQPLAFDLLAYFIANAGRVIEKDELLTKVWRNSVGSDEKIARAVMKVRRAIGDGGQQPRFLKTVHRKGYRLDLEVRTLEVATDEPPRQRAVDALAAAPRSVVLLDCRNGTGDSDFDWIEQGFAGLLQQMLAQHAQLVPLPADWAKTGVRDDPFLSACEALGSSEAVRIELHGSGSSLELLVQRGFDQASVESTTIGGATVVELVRELSRSLIGVSVSSPEPGTEQSFWEEQLARAHDLDRRGSPERALALMDECLQRLPASAQLLLDHSAMLRKAGRRDEAGKQARAALEMTGNVSTAIRARALLEMATQAWHEMKTDDAARLSEEALSAAQADASSAALIPDILLFYASISRERMDPVQGVRLAERAMAAAIAVGNRSKETRARVVLGAALLHAGLTHRAADVLRRAADLAHRHGFVSTGAYALRTLALLDEQVGRYDVAIDEARRSAALAASVGILNLRDSARVQEMVSLVHAGFLDDASAAANRVAETADRAWENAYSLRYGRALLAWRQGRGQEAAIAMRSVADEGRKAGLRFANVARLEECLQWVTLGNLSASQEACDDLSRADAKVAVLQAEAALRLAQGDRAGCITKLRDAAGAALLDSADAVQIDLNLAWLLLEENQLDEASALVGNVAEGLSEGLPARILNAGHLLVTNPGSLADGEWATLVSASPRLLSTCPWLLDADAGDMLRAGRLRPLPSLLTRACW